MTDERACEVMRELGDLAAGRTEECKEATR